MQETPISESLLKSVNNLPMGKEIRIKNKILPYNKILRIEGDKSLSIRWALLASQSTGISKAINLLRSEDVVSTLNCLKRLGVKIKFINNHF